MAATKAPVYFLSHGGPNVMYEPAHPVFPVLQSIGQEITKKVKPSAVVVFSAHWETGPGHIEVNTAEKTDLIYDFYGFPDYMYRAQYPSKGSPELASKVLSLLKQAGIACRGVTRGLDHGVFAGFHVAFDPKDNPLNVPLVQVSLFRSEDADLQHRLGQAVAALRDDNVVIVGAGMSVHNLGDMASMRGEAAPLPYTVSFDEALRPAAEAAPAERQALMAAILKRPDARQAHPRMEHLMPLYIVAGAAGEDVGKRIWTMHEGCLAWSQYRFGEVADA